MMYVPEFVALYEIIPYIRNLPLDNDTIRNAVKDYLEGGKKKDVIIKKYGKIEDWNTSEVTRFARRHLGFFEGIHKVCDQTVVNLLSKCA